MTKISVLLPLYNDEKYVFKAVKSILSSTYKSFELIIINDGSTDGSLEIANNFKDDRIKIFSKSNSGLIETLNYGLKKCNYPIFMRADADDIVHEQKIEKQLNYFKQSKSILVGTEAFIINNDEKIIDSISLPNENNKIINRLINLKPGIIHATIMGSVDSLKKVNFYSDKIKHAEDYDLFFRLSNVGRFSNLNEKLYFIRKNNENVSYLYSNEQLINTLITRKYYLTRRTAQSISEKTYQSIKKKLKKSLLIKLYLKIHNIIVLKETSSNNKLLIIFLKSIRVFFKKFILNKNYNKL